MTKCDTVIELRQVSKEFYLYSRNYQRLLGQIGIRPSNVEKKIALDNITFSIKKGEKVGLIGRNGAGKTTLLRIISGFSKQTSGVFTAQGNIQSLMHRSFGFVDELTGRENIHNSLIYNETPELNKEDAIEDIIQFVELGQFIDQPVHTYSLGMRARLEFAVATAINPDILIIDELLGAGDGYFVSKCRARMNNLVNDTTLLLVSHSIGQIQEYCDRVIWLDKGGIKDDGPAETILANYSKHLTEQQSTQINDKKEEGSEKIRYDRALFWSIITKNFKPTAVANRTIEISYKNSDGTACNLDTGQQLSLEVRGYTDVSQEIRIFGFSLFGDLIFEILSKHSQLCGAVHVTFEFDRLTLGTGEYVLVPALIDKSRGSLICFGDKDLYLKVAPGNWSDPPLLHLNSYWTSDMAQGEINSKISSKV